MAHSCWVYDLMIWTSTEASNTFHRTSTAYQILLNVNEQGANGFTASLVIGFYLDGCLITQFNQKETLHHGSLLSTKAKSY